MAPWTVDDIARSDPWIGRPHKHLALNGQSAVGGARWIKMDLLIRTKWTKMNYSGPFFTRIQLRAVSQKGGLGECALVTVFVPGECANVPSFRFSFRGNIRMYPRSGFRSGGKPAKTTLWENCECKNPAQNRLILTKMVVLTILDHLGRAHLPAVPRPLLVGGRIEHILKWGIFLLTVGAFLLTVKLLGLQSL